MSATSFLDFPCCSACCRDEDIIYRSDRNLDQQSRDLDADEFDRRLGQKVGDSDRSFGDWAQAQPQEVDRDSEWRQQRR